MTDKMKILLNSKDKTAYNLANVISISVSGNHLMLALTDGREPRFIYGSADELNALFGAIMTFLADDEAKVFDCQEFMKTI